MGGFRRFLLLVYWSCYVVVIFSFGFFILVLVFFEDFSRVKKKGV